MPSDFVEVVSVVPFAVVFEDIGVRLPGRGSRATVSSSLLGSSRDYAAHRDWVSVRAVKREVPMPIWPFAKARPPDPVPVALPSTEMDDIKTSVRRIAEAVESLLQRPSPPAPEVVAAHVKNIQSMQTPAGLPGAPRLPGPGSSADPVFIPSRISPDSAESNIKVREEEVDKGDIDDGVEALRRLRRGTSGQ
jgi:hypothetical protein